MKNLLMFLFAATVFLTANSCKDDEHMHTNEEGFEYHAHIDSPTADMKLMGETLDIKVDFESHAGKTVHHVKVTLTEKDGTTPIIDEPADAHVHAMDGAFSYTKSIEMTEANGFAAHTDYVLEARVWAEEEGKEEVVETVEFHLHMN